MTDWLSDFGHWLLVSEAGLWVGAALMWGGILTLAGYLVWRYGDVRMGTWKPPVKPLSEATTVIVPTFQAAPNYHRGDMYAVAGAVVEALDAMADAVTEVIEVKSIDPLDVTAELEAIDPSVPIFYAVKRPPPPPDLETHTQAWTRDGLLARIREGMKP